MFDEAGQRTSRERLNEISKEVVDACYCIHSHLGPGLLESAYQKKLLVELRSRGLMVLSEVWIDTVWKGEPIERAFHADLIIERCVLVELKAVDQTIELHEAQVRTDLKLLDYRLGLLINFNKIRVKHGIRRIVTGF